MKLGSKPLLVSELIFSTSLLRTYSMNAFRFDCKTHTAACSCHMHHTIIMILLSEHFTGSRVYRKFETAIGNAINAAKIHFLYNAAVITMLYRNKSDRMALNALSFVLQNVDCMVRCFTCNFVSSLFDSKRNSAIKRLVHEPEPS